MHFIPQTIIAAIAWGAGMKTKSESQQSYVPQNEAPKAIQDAYNILRNHIENDSRYEQAKVQVKIIEQAMRELNWALPGGIPENIDEADIKAAHTLLVALDKERKTWRENISGYGTSA